MIYVSQIIRVENWVQGIVPWKWNENVEKHSFCSVKDCTKIEWVVPRPHPSTKFCWNLLGIFLCNPADKHKPTDTCVEVRMTIILEIRLHFIIFIYFLWKHTNITLEKQRNILSKDISENTDTWRTEIKRIKKHTRPQPQLYISLSLRNHTR